MKVDRRDVQNELRGWQQKGCEKVLPVLEDPFQAANAGLPRKWYSCSGFIHSSTFTCICWL